LTEDGAGEDHPSPLDPALVRFIEALARADALRDYAAAVAALAVSAATPDAAAGGEDRGPTFNPQAIDAGRAAAFSSAMEIESKRDEVRASWPRAEAEALLQAADDGFKIILALDQVRITSTTERTIETLRSAIGRRGANVSATFTRVEAAALDKAADTGLRVVPEFPEVERDHGAAQRGRATLTAAIFAATPAN
jgi:hypothetical protein